MGVAIDSETKTYPYAGGQHALQDILAHFGIESLRADAVRQMLCEVHKTYYSGTAKDADLWYWTNRFLSPEKELPNSVLSTYCRSKGLIPPALEKTG